MHIVIILDRSGSMAHTADDTRGSLHSLAAEYPEATFSMVEFGNGIVVTVEDGLGGDLKKAADAYRPQGGTPLYDGIAHAFATVVKMNGAQELIAVITDGHENESRKWTKEHVKVLLELAQKAKVGVLFIGANIDAFSEASGLGIARENTLSFASTRGLSQTLGTALTQSVAQYATTGAVSTEALQAKIEEEQK